MSNRRRVGAHYEQLAAAFLVRHGYRILECNYRTRGGEIDLVAQKDECYVFCEVKYRRTAHAGHPLEAVSYQKQRQISKMAMFYLAQHSLGSATPIRFDVIGIKGDGSVTHIENAFAYNWRM